jgi:hypothetical protein
VSDKKTKPKAKTILFGLPPWHTPQIMVVSEETKKKLDSIGKTLPKL